MGGMMTLLSRIIGKGTACFVVKVAGYTDCGLCRQQTVASQLRIRFN